jgi:hypothetical protein
MPRGIFLLALAATVGCGTPSRQLTTRIVDDPMVFPRRMLSMSVQGEVGQQPRPQFFWSVIPGVQYGLSDRLELDDLLSVRWAVLDDAPQSPDSDRRRDRLSLAVRGGVQGVGVSSLSGFIVLPVASAEVGKHLGQETWVSARLAWEAEWAESPGLRSGSYTDVLWPSDMRRSWTGLDATALRQLSQHVALQVGLGVHQLQACTFPGCAWAARGGTIRMGPLIRPVRWLTLGLGVYAGARYRPSGIVVVHPDDSLALLPRTASWLGTSGYVGFHW